MLKKAEAERQVREIGMRHGGTTGFEVKLIGRDGGISESNPVWYKPLNIAL